MFKYVIVTRCLLLIISANNSGILKWYIYGSYDVKPNMRGNTGRGIKMGKLFTILASSNKKLNTRRSKKWETIGVDQLMPLVLQTRIFISSGLRIL